MLYRAFFEKRGQAVYISHLDLQRAVMRAMRKAQLPVQYSQGFNPHIYLTFALPLSLGYEGACESFDFKAEENSFDLFAAATALSEALPLGLKVLCIQPAGEKASTIASAKYEISYADPIELEKAVQGYNALEKVTVYRTNKKKQQVEVNLKAHLQNITCALAGERAIMEIVLPAGGTGNVNPELLINFLCDNFALMADGFSVVRTGVLTQSGAIFE